MFSSFVSAYIIYKFCGAVLGIFKRIFTFKPHKAFCLTRRTRKKRSLVKARQRATGSRQRETERQLAAQAREEKALQREQERQAKQNARITQAEADLDFLIRQQDQICELLYINDEEIESITERIRIDKATRSYDSEKRDYRKKEILLKKRIALESKLHTIEKRIAAAEYIINN
jgi:hypothetical protein